MSSFGDKLKQVSFYKICPNQFLSFTLLANERLLLFILYVVKFIYSEKDTKIWQNLRTFLIIQSEKSVVFSDYMNFKSLVLSN